MRPAVEDLRCEDRHEHGVGHAHGADEGNVEQELAHGREAEDVADAVTQLLEHRLALVAVGGARDAHGQERRDDGDVGDRVDQEAPTFADGGDDGAADGRPDDARGVEHRRVQGDGVGQVGAVLDHLDDEGLPRRRIEGVDDALHHLQPDDLGHGDAMG